jgi:hypothetical protein
MPELRDFAGQANGRDNFRVAVGLREQLLALQDSLPEMAGSNDDVVEESVGQFKADPDLISLMAGPLQIWWMAGTRVLHRDTSRVASCN